MFAATPNLIPGHHGHLDKISRISLPCRGPVAIMQARVGLWPIIAGQNKLLQFIRTSTGHCKPTNWCGGYLAGRRMETGT
jgi:hypothetical protein